MTKGVAVKSRPTDASSMATSRGPAIAAVIAKSIEEDIVLGRRHPRERLLEHDLSAHFATHRGDVRLALFELEKRGLIQRFPNRGAIVRDLTPKEVTEIYAVREELEVMAIRSIAFPVAATDIEVLEKIQKEHSAAVDSGDLLAVFYSNLRFHQVMFSLCRNSCLIETIDQLAQKAYGIRPYANSSPDALDRLRRDHRDMMDALRQANRDKLIEVERRHLRPAPEAYIRAYQRRFGNASR